jgi:hypothetical protein
MKKTFAVLLLAVIWALPVFADELPVTGKLFVELKWEYTYKGDDGPWWCIWCEPTWEVRQEQWRLSGSFWALQTSDKPIFVTAAHVLGLNWEPGWIGGHTIDRETAFLRNVKARALIGTLAYEPSDIGRAKDANDAAFLMARDSMAFKTVRFLSLSDSPPQYGETVQVVGYPGTPVQQFATTSVTSVNEDAGFFVLNQAVDDGYSGGVVLNSSGEKAYGVIVNTDSAHKQTTVLRITPEMLSAIDWHPADEVLNHSFE